MFKGNSTIPGGGLSVRKHQMMWSVQYKRVKVNSEVLQGQGGLKIRTCQRKLKPLLASILTLISANVAGQYTRLDVPGWRTRTQPVQTTHWQM